MGDTFLRSALLGTVAGQPVCRLGLATRGDTGLSSADVRHALDRGVNFLNWCGVQDGLARAIAELGSRRNDVVVCVQFEARTAAAARVELESCLKKLHSDYLDVVTFYYVEEPDEWREISGLNGALEFCRAAREAGKLRWLGLTSHQRPLAAGWAQTGLLDLLMIRYNAAHRGAETEVFPIAQAQKIPVVVYTCLRWGALLRGTPDDPPDFVPPRAPAWYRFALQHPAVAVALMAPDGRNELEEDLTLLETRVPLSADEYERLARHGRRVRQHGGSFP